MIIGWANPIVTHQSLLGINLYCDELICKINDQKKCVLQYKAHYMYEIKLKKKRHRTSEIGEPASPCSFLVFS